MHYRFLQAKWPFIALLAGLVRVTEARAQINPAGDAARGDPLFQTSCALCHSSTLGPDQTVIIKLGPTLVGVMGRRAGTSPHFGFTQVLQDSGLVWNAEALNSYLSDPETAVPGTTMLTKVADAADRADVIAYLATLKVPEGLDLDKLPTVTGPDPDDWQRASPGDQHYITVADLPAPFATPSAGNPPSVVRQPANAVLSVPAGFTVKLFASGLNNPRIIRVAPNGDIFVSETAQNRIRVLRSTEGADKPSTNRVFAQGLNRPFGTAFYPPGNNPRWLYVALNNSVVRFAYQDGDLVASGTAQVVVPSLSATTGGHTTRDVAFSQDGTRMFISVGSASNVGEQMGRKTAAEVAAWEAAHGLGAAWGPETHRANILVTDPEGRAPLRPYATGIRNPVGLATHPATGDLWVSTNERDGLGDNLVPDYVTRVREGGFYGWPWYYMGNLEDPRRKGERPDLAGKAIVPDVLEQAHSASLQMTFYPVNKGPAAFPSDYHGDGFVALHGSWNRATRTGYKIVRIPLNGGVPTGRYDDFLTGFVTSDRNVWGRPVGVAVARDGALLMTEDANGTIWRIAYVRPRLSASIVEEGDQKFLMVTVSLSAPTPDVRYTIDVSSDLVTWSADPEIVKLSETPTQLVFRDHVPPQNVTARFLRLRGQ
ncbi:MAG: PQQ-dependent sugar dehydrogenase [Verrucomicrobiales bacterium]|nr:PQQ-dependent sugar dehydrogenase [Verrucomicrobiales bacterium]